MDTDLISIIIPIYNSVRYLQRCLDSVLAQGYTNLDVVLVDDGSTDGSGVFCDEIAIKDKRIHVIHQNNQGASIARLNGLKCAKGEYITFVDSDDWISTDYVSSLYHLIHKYKVNISCCGVYRVNKGKEFNIDNNKSESQLLSFKELMPRFFKYEFWGFPGKLYLRSIFDNILFPKATLSEDYFVMTQLFTKEKQMAYTEAHLYCYEYHENSLSHQKLSKQAFEEFENVKTVYCYTCLYLPEYSDFALSNVVETCVKIFSLAKSDFDNEFEREFKEMRKFLKEHKREIITCTPLNIKVKALSILLLISRRLFLALCP